MPYKIVETREKGMRQLCIVPSFWEENGKLWWPPKKSVVKLIMDENSKPDLGWKAMDCTLKRNDLLTYKQADDELSIMQQNSDTDVPDHGEAVNAMQINAGEINYDLLAQNLTCNQEIEGNNSIPVTQGTVLQIYDTENLNSSQILSNQSNILEKINAMIQLQTLTIENQKKLSFKLASLSVQFDEMATRFLKLEQQPTSVISLKDANPVECESFYLKPIENEHELSQLDNQLSDHTFNLKLKNQFSVLFSVSKGNGQTCAYKLLDIMFSKEFLCQCSWSGGSRGSHSKIALKNYKNIINFFFSLIHSCDSTFTFQKTELFLKTITKNALKRKLMKNLRESSKRCRKSNTSAKRQTSDQEQPDDETKENQEQALNTENGNLPANTIIDCENESLC